MERRAKYSNQGNQVGALLTLLNPLALAFSGGHCAGLHARDPRTAQLGVSAQASGRGGVDFSGESPASTADSLNPRPPRQFRGVNVSLYHSPQMTRLMRALLKPPMNEIMGLTHIKAYIFDDTLLISG